MNTKIVQTKKDEKDITVVVKSPTPKQMADAMLYSSRIFRQGVDEKLLPRAKIHEYMKVNGLWNDEQEEKLQDIIQRLRDGEAQFKRGGKDKDGNPFTLQQAKALALKMKTWRLEYAILSAAYSNLDMHSVEGRAENAKFDYLVAACSYDEEQKHLFKSIDDYLEKSTEQYAYDCASALHELVSGFTEESEKKWVENKFLIDHGFARESDLRLVNKEGQLVDSKGRRVDEDGDFVDDEGNKINEDGKKLDESGNEIIEFTPFAE